MRVLLPAIQEVISELECDEGYLKFPEQFSKLMTRDDLPPWASYYEQPAKMRSLLAQSLVSTDELAHLDLVFTSSSQDIHALRMNIQKKVLENFGGTPIQERLDSISPDEIGSMWAGASATEKTQPEVGMYLIFCAILTQLHFYLALITCGKNICVLVEEAKAGNDDSFCDAVQIDRTVLFGIPYFQKRLIRAQLGREPKFLKQLSNAVKAKPLGNKFSHKMLMFVFAILEDERLLDELSQEQLMNICEELGVYGHAYDVEDPASLGRLLNRYKQRTRRQIQI